MATKRRFQIGDEVVVKGMVRLIDAAGTGTVTIEIQRVTVSATSGSIELVSKAPLGRRNSPVDR